MFWSKILKKNVYTFLGPTFDKMFTLPHTNVRYKSSAGKTLCYNFFVKDINGSNR